MWRSLRLVVALIPPIIGSPSVEPKLTLELRLFNGGEEVTAESRITVHRAGDRTGKIAQKGSGNPRIELLVAEGIYDVQAIREGDGRVLNIRWADRLVVMPYPDEGGRHLEVINFQPGYGALQVRARGEERIAVSVFRTSDRSAEAAPRLDGPGYSLFVVPAGVYDLQVVSGTRPPVWKNGIEIPMDRTRLWVVP